MKYVKATVKYLFAHLPKLLALSVVPAAVIAFFMQPQGFGLILPADSLAEVDTFSDVFFLVFNRKLITKWPYMIVVGLVLMQICISYTMGIVEKHFRVGKLTLRQPFANINNCFQSVFKVLALLVVIYILYKFLLVCLLTLFTRILGNFGISEIWISVIMAILNAAGFFILLGFVRPIMFTAATMLVYGYSFKDAFGVAIKLGETSGRFELNLALILPFAVYFILSSLFIVLSVPEIIQELFHTVFVSLLIQYVTVYVLVAMFELSGIERRDRRTLY